MFWQNGETDKGDKEIYISSLNDDNNIMCLGF